MTEEEIQEIHDICADIAVKIENYTINEDGTVDVDGDVDLEGGGWFGMPFRFGKVNGNFNCADNDLTSLEGTPHTVTGIFNCEENKLTSLEGGPTNVGESYFCGGNELTTLKGSPKELYNFDCHDNKLTTLEHCPEIIRRGFNCGENKLTTLKYIPKVIGKLFNCSFNFIYDLDGYDTDLECRLFINNNPISTIFTDAKPDFIQAFNVYKVVKDKTINFKRLRYVMELFDKRIILTDIKQEYTII